MKSIYKLIIFLAFVVTSITILRYYSSKNPPPPPIENPATAGPTLTPTPIPLPNTFKVKRVIDGDTIVLEDDTKVRLIGINSPESDICYASEATDAVIQLLEGKNIVLEKDVSDKDKYDRLLRYVYMDNIFVNKYLVEEGYAQVVTYPPDVKYKDILLNAQVEAKETESGLWGSCPVEPKE